MGIRYTADGQEVGYHSGSILPKYEIRTRKQGGKKWYVFNLDHSKQAFEADTRRECIEYCLGNANLYHLVSTHEWGMQRVCKACGQNLHLSKFRLNGLPGTQKRKYAHWRSKCLKCEYQSDKRRKPVEPWWTVFEEV